MRNFNPGRVQAQLKVCTIDKMSDTHKVTPAPYVELHTFASFGGYENSQHVCQIRSYYVQTKDSVHAVLLTKLQLP